MDTATQQQTTTGAPSAAGVDKDNQVAAPPKPRLESGGQVGAIIPRTIEEVLRLAKWIAAAGWAPKAYQENGKFSEEKIAVGIMHGLEVGFTPIAALQSIAVINGMPSVFGDGALALCQNSGLMTDFREERILANGKVTGYRCIAVRRGTPTPFVQEFTLEDAAKAKLIDKPGPWKEYPQRMLQMRARAWTLRAGFADVLRGLHIAEEARDITDAVIITETPKAQASAASALDAFAGAPATSTAAPTGDGNSGPEPVAAPVPGAATAQAENVDKETGEITPKPGIPQPSEETLKAWAEDKKWGPMWKWFCETMENSMPGTRSNLCFVHGDLIKAVHAYSPKYAETVEASMKRWGMEDAIPRK